ncbi:MAG: hypothetical protein NZM43_05220 [Saprospiraceae bacterium]|nr:hypothetical protein [Saprospiraceae bacterium]MDW8483708.1 hypothetical protein [Saprospiraceae bacterium]
MIKDISFLKVDDLALAMAPRLVFEENHEDFWDAYLLNLKDEPINSVIVSATGYGEIEGIPRRTTSLRYFWEQIAPRTVVRIEPVSKAVFALTSEYWVSFMYKGYLYDKKYLFVPGIFDEMHFCEIPILQRQGVMIR